MIVARLHCVQAVAAKYSGAGLRDGVVVRVFVARRTSEQTECRWRRRLLICPCSAGVEDRRESSGIGGCRSAAGDAAWSS